MYINERTQYDKAQATISKKHQLSAMVRTKSSRKWAASLRKNINDVKIRNWVASIIWWSYPEKKMPSRHDPLFKMMDDFHSSVSEKKDELNAAFIAVGLPSPERIFLKV